MNYVLVTSAYNEEKNIKHTLDSVVSQSMLPTKWVIASDGSTDSTDAIILEYAHTYPFIRYLRIEKKEKHSYGAKVRALNKGFEILDVPGWDFIGVLDADISFDVHYFETLYGHFCENPKLGVTGGMIVELHNGRIKPQNISFESSVAGAVQLFRRECFARIGRFIPLPYGSEDAAAEITARTYGWQVKTCTALKVLHYGFVGKGSGHIIKAKYRRGQSYYQLGYHPLFQLTRFLFRILDKPYFIGSLAELAGYAGSYLLNGKKMLPQETIRFLRKEQMIRLKRLLK
jgi:glycosyltransferase involved in cell wall biosynthesis